VHRGEQPAPPLVRRLGGKQLLQDRRNPAVLAGVHLLERLIKEGCLLRGFIGRHWNAFTVRRQIFA